MATLYYCLDKGHRVSVPYGNSRFIVNGRRTCRSCPGGSGLLDNSSNCVVIDLTKIPFSSLPRIVSRMLKERAEENFRILNDSTGFYTNYINSLVSNIS